MQVVVSDDRQTVVVFDSTTEAQYTMDEFVKIYGVESLPKEARKISEEEVRAIQKQVEEAEEKYLNAFLEYLDAVGKYIHLAKLDQNASDGVYPVQVVAYNYGHVGHFAQELDERNRARWSKLRALDLLSKSAGYLPLNDEGMQKIMKFFEDSDRRRYARANIRRMLKTGECLSIADLMRKRYQVEKKNQERSKSSLKI